MFDKRTIVSFLGLTLAWLCLAAAPHPPPWSASAPSVQTSVRTGRPLVTVVIVPLCSNAQLNCGSTIAGRPADLAHNIYWGAIFGARRFLDRPTSGFTRIDVAPAAGALLEQVTYRRMVAGQVWGLSASSVEQLVILQAVHGDQIDTAVESFWRLATEGGTVTFHDGARVRREQVDVVGYAGHNRLMDGVSLPAPPPASRKGPIAAFVLGCYSEPTFGPALRAASVQVILTTRAFMAPEGYLVEAVVRGLGDNRSRAAIRHGAIEASMKWQQLARRDAAWVFAPADR